MCPRQRDGYKCSTRVEMMGLLSDEMEVWGRLEEGEGGKEGKRDCEGKGKSEGEVGSEEREGMRERDIVREW